MGLKFIFMVAWMLLALVARQGFRTNFTAGARVWRHGAFLAQPDEVLADRKRSAEEDRS